MRGLLENVSSEDVIKKLMFYNSPIHFVKGIGKAMIFSIKYPFSVPRLPIMQPSQANLAQYDQILQVLLNGISAHC